MTSFEPSRWDWLVGTGLLVGVVIAAVIIAFAVQLLGLAD